MPQLDPLEIIAKVQGEQDIEHLEQKIGHATNAIKALSEQMHKHAIDEQQFTRSAKLHAEIISDSTAKINELKQNLASFKMREWIDSFSGDFAKNLGRGLHQVGDESQAMRLNILQAAYALDDLQYGFHAVLNNIPGLVMGLGGGMGLAGVVSIAALAVSKLADHWDELMAKLVGSSQRLEDAKTFINELGTSVAEEVDKGFIGAGKGAIESSQDDEQKKNAEVFKKALTKYGPRKLEEELAKKFMEETLGTSTIEAAAGVTVRPGHEVDDRNAAVEIMTKKAREYAQGRIGLGAKGDVGSSLLAGEYYGGDFGKEFKDQIAAAKNREQEKELDDEAKLAEKEYDRKTKMRQQAHQRMMRDADEEEQELKRQNDQARKDFEKDKRAKVEDIQDKIESLQLKRETLTEAFSHQEHSQTMSARAYATKITQGGFDQVAKDQLTTLRGIKLVLEGYQKQLRHLGRMRFPED